jgi:hypothetical protein
MTPETSGLPGQCDSATQTSIMSNLQRGPVLLVLVACRQLSDRQLSRVVTRQPPLGKGNLQRKGACPTSLYALSPTAS